jgi:hypothetical protein
VTAETGARNDSLDDTMLAASTTPTGELMRRRRRDVGLGDAVTDHALPCHRLGRVLKPIR